MSSRFPPAGLFDRVAHPDDLEVVYAIEALTNDRLREEAGDLALVAPADRISGPGTTPIMAAFTHVNPLGSRFSDASYGVYYAAREIDTAVAETRFHRARFLAATREEPIEIDMRSYATDLDARLHDIRDRHAWSHLYDPDPGRYAVSQAFAVPLRERGSNGLVYWSVRNPAGQCAAVFRPRVLRPAVQGTHFCFVWDGSEITDVYTKSAWQPRKARGVPGR